MSRCDISIRHYYFLLLPNHPIPIPTMTTRTTLWSWWGAGSSDETANVPGIASATTSNNSINNISRRSSSMTACRDIEEAGTGHDSSNATNNNNNKNNNTSGKKDPLVVRRPSLKSHEMALPPSVEKPPLSRGIPHGHLPLTINTKTQHVPAAEPKLIHP